MTQYDAGPGDWSDREWEAPDYESQPHTQRKRLALPPWALLAAVAAVVVILCLGLVMIANAVRKGNERPTPTPLPTATMELLPSATLELPMATAIFTEPTPTLELPTEVPTETVASAAEIVTGSVVVVQGTEGQGLNLRKKPSASAKLIANVKEGSELTVLTGPQEAEGYVWWKLRAANGKQGWAASQWLVVKPQ